MRIISVKWKAVWRRSQYRWRNQFIDWRYRPHLKQVFFWPKALNHLTQQQVLGRWGERLAAEWLRQQGCRILYRNFRAKGGGEIDLVCRDSNELVFVEVKTRRSERFGRPALAVTADKERLILKGANAWLAMLPHSDTIQRRCDIVEVLLIEGELPKLSILKGALQMRYNPR